MSEEFKLNIYFNIYKNSPIGSRDSFREKFIKKHGRYHYLPELIHMIERYQYDKYGLTIWSDASYSTIPRKKRR